ncbi:hypothetical protein PAPYR_10611 [Paratrimastix pyriformis]|uniref:Uncharacterized protein n=1 Tax=Paratrimastix pyriformis TaxID=342808 RepID=A0ABQ8UCS4_9EUKA|nr:hypothetical protein PAPYR_10611 [Paratrimastix pyriformis]
MGPCERLLGDFILSPRASDFFAVGCFAYFAILVRIFLVALWGILQEPDSVCEPGMLSNAVASFVGGFTVESRLPHPLVHGLVEGLAGTLSSFSDWQLASHRLAWKNTVHDVVQALVGQGFLLLVSILPWLFGRFLYRSWAMYRHRHHPLEALPAYEEMSPISSPSSPPRPMSAISESGIISAPASSTPSPNPLQQVDPLPLPPPSFVSLAPHPRPPAPRSAYLWPAGFVALTLGLILLASIFPGTVTTTSGAYPLWLSCLMGPLGAWLRVALENRLDPGHSHSSPTPSSSSPHPPFFYLGTYLANLGACLLVPVGAFLGSMWGSLAQTLLVVLAGALSTVTGAVPQLLRTGDTHPWHAALYWLTGVVSAQVIFGLMQWVMMGPDA